MEIELSEQVLADRDSAHDSGILIHEYGHGVSNRLTGGAANVTCLDALQSRAMGEGWSDFWALAILTRETDRSDDLRGLGTFLLGQPENGTGIRAFHYSSDQSVNPVTLSDAPNLSHPHGMGQIWASALLDVFWNLVEVHGFDSDPKLGTGGNDLALELVMDGLKLQACNPTFIEARDAILLADVVSHQGQNVCGIWRGFAGRGLGSEADTGADADQLVIAEDFSIPVECLPEPDGAMLGWVAVVLFAGSRARRRRSMRSAPSKGRLNAFARWRVGVD